MPKQKIPASILIALVIVILGFLIQKTEIAFLVCSNGICSFNLLWKVISGAFWFAPVPVLILSLYGLFKNKKNGTIGWKASFSRVVGILLLIYSAYSIFVTLFFIVTAGGLGR